MNIYCLIKKHKSNRKNRAITAEFSMTKVVGEVLSAEYSMVPSVIRTNLINTYQCIALL